MNTNDNDFCDDCMNLMTIVSDSDDKIKYLCKCCGFKREFEDETICIYNNTTEKLDRSEYLNTNPYLTHDITLPKIENNKNIKCQNPECPKTDSSITYMKYHSDNMYYMYICNHCGQQWVNNSK